MKTLSERFNITRGRDVTLIDVNESLQELLHRLKKMDEAIPTSTCLLGLIGDAMTDSFAVLDCIEEDEIEIIRLDDESPLLQDNIIADPIEAFHFNLVEEITTTFIKSSRKKIRRPYGFNLANWPQLVVYS